MLFFFVMIIEDIYFSLPQPKVFFIVVLVIFVSAPLHSHVFSLSVWLLNMNCSGEVDTTNRIIGVEMKNLENLEGVCKSSPGDAV